MINNTIFSDLVEYTGLSQREIAKRLGLNESHISAYKNSLPLSEKKLNEMAKGLGIQISTFNKNGSIQYNFSRIEETDLKTQISNYFGGAGIELNIPTESEDFTKSCEYCTHRKVCRLYYEYANNNVAEYCDCLIES